MPLPLPTFGDILAAAARIAPHAHATPVLRSSTLDALAGCRLYFKAEPLQRGGAFKFRGACNAVWALEDAEAARGVVTHSSGNHGAALALAARTRGIPCHVVVPEGANAAKLANITRYGAQIHLCAATIAAREAAADRVQAETGAILIHPYTHPHVIAGQGTAALELLNAYRHIDTVVAPVGEVACSPEQRSPLLRPRRAAASTAPSRSVPPTRPHPGGRQARTGLRSRHGMRRIARNARRTQFRTAASTRCRGAHRAR